MIHQPIAQSVVSPDLHADWPIPSTLPELHPQQIHIWQIDLAVNPNPLQHYQSLLTADELSRAQRFQFATHRQHFMVSRGVLRQLLGHYRQQPAEHLTFEYNQYGKPQLAQTPMPLHFNVSHSGSQALMAFTAVGAIGIDLESTDKTLEWDNICRRFFAPQEIEQIFALPPAQQKSAFFQCWTRKEAFIKARGDGLSFSLKNFAVTVTGAAKLLWCTEPDELQRWQLQALQPAPGYAAALSVEVAQDAHRKPLQCHGFQWVHPNSQQSA